MTLSDLKYITQQNIDESCITAESAAVYAEADKYNLHMARMRVKRRIFLFDFLVMVMADLGFTCFGLVPILWSDFDGFAGPKRFLFSGSLMYKLTGNVFSALIPWVIFLFAFSYFIIKRRLYKWQLGLLFAVLLIPASFIYLIPSAANILMLYLMEKTDIQIRDEIGYPHFIPLTINTHTSRKQKN